MLCKWIKKGDKYQCKYCNFVTTIEGLQKNCLALMIKSPKPQRPNPIQRTANFAKAATQHLIHGHPKCSQEEIQERFKICQANECGFFQEKDDRGFCTHKQCGCNLNLQKYI